MARLWHDALRRPGGDLPFLALCVATALSMFRAVDEPGFSVHVGGTDVSVVPTDIALAVLGVFCIARLLGRRTLPQPARSITAAGLAFCAWLLISSALNGFTTLVGAVKLLEYAILGLGAVLFLQRRSTFWSFVALLVALAALADLYALKGFVQHPGARQNSFTGAHDLAALCSMSLVLAFAALFTRQHRLGKLPLAAGIVGAVGVILGAALASLLGVYLAAVAVVALAAARRVVTLRALLATGAILAVVTAGSLSLRSSELGFLNAWFGSTQKAKPGQYAASWSQRLIYVYIGGRVFEANPVLGTGWYGELPPKEWARFLPDAKRKFPDQPREVLPEAGSESDSAADVRPGAVRARARGRHPLPRARGAHRPHGGTGRAALAARRRGRGGRVPARRLDGLDDRGHRGRGAVRRDPDHRALLAHDRPRRPLAVAHAARAGRRNEQPAPAVAAPA